MPLQNRVTPWGGLVAVPERGLMFGNRGVLHDANRTVVRHHRGERWIACLLEFRGRRRQIMRPGHYTELFFLDEATALAAGHRPCAECRRQDYEAFRRAYATAHRRASTELPSAGELDAHLHQDRLTISRAKRTYLAKIETLPDGVFVERDGEAWLISKADLLRWTPGGYDRRIPLPEGSAVTVLTPRATVETIAAGYHPVVHSSVESADGSSGSSN